MSTSSNVRLIKKYQNRRLYDTEDSIYITLSEVRDLVMEGVDFTVQDAKTKGDITRQVLLSIILEEEAGGGPLFSNQLLRQIISFYGHAFQSAFGRFLESNMRGFSEAQEQFQEHMQKIIPKSENEGLIQQMSSPLMATKQMENLFTPYFENSKMMFEAMADSFRDISKTMPQTASPVSPLKPDRSNTPPKKTFEPSFASDQATNSKYASTLKRKKNISKKTKKNSQKNAQQTTDNSF